MGPSTAVAGPSRGVVERLNGGVSNSLLPSWRPYTHTHKPFQLTYPGRRMFTCSTSEHSFHRLWLARHECCILSTTAATPARLQLSLDEQLFRFGIAPISGSLLASLCQVRDVEDVKGEEWRTMVSSRVCSAKKPALDPLQRLDALGPA